MREQSKSSGRQGGGVYRRGRALVLFGVVSVCAAAVVVPWSGVSAQAAGTGSGMDAGDATSALKRPGIDGWSTQTETVRGAMDSGPAATGEDAAALLAAGSLAEGRGDIDAAQRLYERVIGSDPGSPVANVARQRLGAIYRGDVKPGAGAAHAPRDGGQSAAGDGTIHAVPLPDLGTAGLDHPSAEAAKARQPDLAVDAGVASKAGTTAAMEMPTSNGSSAQVAPVRQQPWRQRARLSHRFEQLLRADIGDRVFFGVSSAEIGGRARIVLERQAQWLARYPELYVVVEGHADEPGSDTDNDAVAQLRAETVRRLLIGAGLMEDRVDVDVRGRKDRVVVCESADCRSQNRRAVIRLMVVLPARPGDRSSLWGVPDNGGELMNDVGSGAEPQQVAGNLVSQR